MMSEGVGARRQGNVMADPNPSYFSSSNAAGKEARFKMDVRNAGCRRLDAVAWCCFLTGQRKETAVLFAEEEEW